MEQDLQKAETVMRVAYSMHSDCPELWGWEISGKNGYSWGTASSEREALVDAINRLKTDNL